MSSGALCISIIDELWVALTSPSSFNDCRSGERKKRTLAASRQKKETDKMWAWFFNLIAHNFFVYFLFALCVLFYWQVSIIASTREENSKEEFEVWTKRSIKIFFEQKKPAFRQAVDNLKVQGGQFKLRWGSCDSLSLSIFLFIILVGILVNCIICCLVYSVMQRSTNERIEGLEVIYAHGGEGMLRCLRGWSLSGGWWGWERRQ